MRARAIAGGVILIFGFLMYQTGISIALESNKYTLRFLEAFTSLFQINLKSDIVIIFIEYVGGIIAIVGFLICISSLASREAVTVYRQVEAGEKEATVSEAPLKCKYCGAYVEEEDVFCAKCNRALK